MIGSQKVEGEVYRQADANISIGNQPHSEIAALAVFLDRLFSGREISKQFKGCRLEIIPAGKGKKIVEK